MVAKNLILGITILSFSIGIAAHYNWGNGWGNGYYPQQQQQPNYRPGRQTYYPSQTKFQSTVKLPPGVSVDNAEWVCTSPKTGDMVSKLNYTKILIFLHIKQAWKTLIVSKTFESYNRELFNFVSIKKYHKSISS